VLTVPPTDSYQGLLLGNGDIAVSSSVRPSSLHCMSVKTICGITATPWTREAVTPPGIFEEVRRPKQAAVHQLPDHRRSMHTTSNSAHLRIADDSSKASRTDSFPHEARRCHVTGEKLVFGRRGKCNYRRRQPTLRALLPARDLAALHRVARRSGRATYIVDDPSESVKRMPVAAIPS